MSSFTLLILVSLENIDIAFSEYYNVCTVITVFFFLWRVRRTFSLPDGVFQLLCDNGLDFDISLINIM